MLLLDARRDPSEEDVQMLELLADLGAPTVIAATKVDKLKPRERQERLATLGESLGMSPDQIVPFSAVTGEGRDDLAEAIVGLVDAPSWREE